MTHAAFIRHLGRTSRPLGIGEMFSKLVAAFTSSVTGAASHRANKLTAGQFAAAVEAAAVRQMADEQRRWSPGFAADLYAAADRHERKNQH